MRAKGQGALEYLLMIGAGVAIAAVVMYFLFGTVATTTCDNYKRNIKSLCNAKPKFECDLAQVIVDTELTSTKQCYWETSVNRCIANEGAVADPIDWTESEFCD